MKTTVELPDALMTELKIIGAKEHKKLREVMQEVVELGLRARRLAPGDGTSAQAASDAESWLRGWQELGARIEREAVDPRPCVDILLADRR